jgi:hypothetical protein
MACVGASVSDEGCESGVSDVSKWPVWAQEILPGLKDPGAEYRFIRKVTSGMFWGGGKWRWGDVCWGERDWGGV